MKKRLGTAARRRVAVVIAMLGCVALPIVLYAAAKDYPIQGTVTALGTSREAAGGQPVLNMDHRTYTVKTPDRVYVLECPYWMTGVHIHSPKECGGSKKIELGNQIQFRIEKTHAYLQTDTGKEQKLNVLSEGIVENGSQETAKEVTKQ